MSAPNAPSPAQMAREALAREVAALDAVTVHGVLRGFAPVRLPLRVTTTASGLSELVDTRTGEGCGICASAAIAERVRHFFQ